MKAQSFETSREMTQKISKSSVFKRKDCLLLVRLSQKKTDIQLEGVEMNLFIT